MRNLATILLSIILFTVPGVTAWAAQPWDDARPGDAGPRDTKAIMRGAAVAVGFTPVDGTTYRLYRHDRTNGRRFVSHGQSVIYNGNGSFNTSDPFDSGQDGDSGWFYDATYNYLFYIDPNVNPYEEYYYLVWSDRDRVPAGQAIADPNDYLNAYMIVPAFPPTQTRHGSYSERTEACTACHGLHSALHPKLLKGPTTTDLCGTCHDGSGSKYDMVNGVVRTGPDWETFTKSPAGPFGTQLRDVAGAPVLTSRHNVLRAGLQAGGGVADTAAQLWQAPGSSYLAAGSAPGGSAWTSALLCTSCHEPHNRFNNYRLLRGDFSVGEYALPALGGTRTGINVRGVSEVFPSSPAPPLDRSWQPRAYTQGQAASRYLGGSNLTGAAIADFCSACHRVFTIRETVPAEVYGVLGEHRHAVAIPASDAYRLGRIIEGPLDATGEICSGNQCDREAAQKRLEDFQGGNLVNYVPLEGRLVDDPMTQGNEYADNKVVCLTCHVAHGTGAYAGGELAYGGGGSQLEPAYRNNALNDTGGLPETYQEDPSTGTQRGRNPIAGYLFNRSGGQILGSTSVLTRFEPFASVCYRCHTTK